MIIIIIVTVVTDYNKLNRNRLCFAVIVQFILQSPPKELKV